MDKEYRRETRFIGTLLKALFARGNREACEAVEQAVEHNITEFEAELEQIERESEAQSAALKAIPEGLDTDAFLEELKRCG